MTTHTEPHDLALTDDTRRHVHTLFMQYATGTLEHGKPRLLARLKAVADARYNQASSPAHSQVTVSDWEEELKPERGSNFDLDNLTTDEVPEATNRFDEAVCRMHDVYVARGWTRS